MIVHRVGSRKTLRASADYFTGTVHQDPILEAPAPANLRVFEEERVLETLPGKIEAFATALQEAAERTPASGQVRQLGLIAGIDLIDPATGIAPD